MGGRLKDVTTRCAALPGEIFNAGTKPESARKGASCLSSHRYPRPPFRPVYVRRSNDGAREPFQDEGKTFRPFRC